MSVLLSIKPKYVEKIIDGDKKYEFRKAIFKVDCQMIYIYASMPVKKIVGAIFPGQVDEDTPKNLWLKYKDLAGIQENEFFEYYAGKAKGFAIEIGQVGLFENPIDPRECLPDFSPPQSFCYVNDELLERHDLIVDGDVFKPDVMQRSLFDIVQSAT
ncbi:MAG: hypothetical protein AUK32_04580 [Candidatus Aquicultor secundus]|uniref:hypothetical protein n=1 Tax=Candidatus Aquicultor secundus TaxID=1973895 RepID=UPI00091CA999|nr:hypothetical protein [Candidatus Aquicultor secundus]OIO87016.1 MAG: hypothetical protein AUK32_04580 [Candidatus Aquicultor secundus]